MLLFIFHPKSPCNSIKYCDLCPEMQLVHYLPIKFFRLLSPLKKYYADPSEQDDLISIGTIGLIKAVSTYQPDKGVRLATYAARCIENEILMHFRAGRKSQNDVSLDESPDSDEDSNSLALLGTISVEDERLHLVEMSDRYQTMYDCLSRNLSPREKHILTLRYGLNGHDPLPQREVAAALGISRSYVLRRH